MKQNIYCIKANLLSTLSENAQGARRLFSEIGIGIIRHILILGRAEVGIRPNIWDAVPRASVRLVTFSGCRAL